MIEATLKSMRRRMSWTEARKILRRAGVPTGHGWDKTIEKINAGKFEHLDAALKDGLIEHIMVGGKYTKLFEFDPSKRTQMQERLAAVEVGDVFPAGTFPGQFEDAELENHPPGFVPVASFRDEDGIGLIASAAFQIKKREQIPFYELENPEVYRGRYEEIIGVKLRWVQIMSVVWVPHHRSQAELRVDYPAGMTQVEVRSLHHSLRVIASKWLDEDLGDSAINLFPAVRPFYDDQDEGRVTEIMFSTTTGGVKNERILKKKRAIDQRDEAYHLAGKEGLDHDINLFQVAVEWNKEEDGELFKPGISLGSTGPSGRGPGGIPTVTGVAINGCVRTSDYEFVIDRLSRKLAKGLAMADANGR